MDMVIFFQPLAIALPKVMLMNMFCFLASIAVNIHIDPSNLIMARSFMSDLPLMSLESFRDVVLGVCS